MLEERVKVEEALRAVFGREGFGVRPFPYEHAGGKWSLRYESVIGKGGDLELDLNFMFRIPLWPVVTQDSRPVGSFKIDGLVKSPQKHSYVIPVKTGIQSFQRVTTDLDTRFRGYDDFLRDHQNSKDSCA